MNPLDVFRAEASALSASLATVTEEEFTLPTRCPPWTVAALLAHVGMGAHRVTLMLAEPAPDAADTDAASYYRLDTRFSPATDSERVESAVAAAARADSGAALAKRFEVTWREAVVAVEEAPLDRVVRTRHGDAMLLKDFMVTRVVELALHGLDLADALDRPPWTHESAVELVTRLLVPEPLMLIRAATGRLVGGDPDRFFRSLALG